MDLSVLGRERRIMNLEAAILTWLMQRPVHKSDIGEVDRLSRMSQVAEAVGVVSGGNRLMAASLLVIADEESAFRRDVQTGNCPKHECDEGRARSAYQLHRPSTVSREEWLGWAGPDYHNVLGATIQASRLLYAGRHKCGNLEGAMAYYATGGKCEWSRAKARADRVLMLAGKL